MVGKKPVTIVLAGGQYDLLYDLNALDRLEKEIGANPFDKETWNSPSPRTLRALVWAGLLRNSPDLTLETVGSWITLDTLIYTQERVGQAFEQAVGSEDESADPTETQMDRTVLAVPTGS